MTKSLITRIIRSSKRLLAVFVVSLGLHTMAHAQDSPGCRPWLEKVTEAPNHVQKKGVESGGGSREPSVAPSVDPWNITSLSEEEKLKAIQCFLDAENDLKPAAFSGATRFDVSQTFAPARVNLAALYAISYIYTGHFDHAAAVALRGEDASYTDSSGNYVTRPSAIHEAYRAYRAWFAKVRPIGLGKAKQSGLQPLDGTALRWY